MMDPTIIPLAASLAGTAGAAVKYVREVGKNNRRAQAARDAGEAEPWNPKVYSRYDHFAAGATEHKRN